MATGFEDRILFGYLKLETTFFFFTAPDEIIHYVVTDKTIQIINSNKSEC